MPWSLMLPSSKTTQSGSPTLTVTLALMYGNAAAEMYHCHLVKGFTWCGIH